MTKAGNDADKVAGMLIEQMKQLLDGGYPIEKCQPLLASAIMKIWERATQVENDRLRALADAD